MGKLFSLAFFITVATTMSYADEMYNERWRGKYQPGYVIQYYLLRDQGLSHDAALHQAYAAWYAKQDQINAQKKAEKNALLGQGLGLASGVAGAGLGGYFAEKGRHAAAKKAIEEGAKKVAASGANVATGGGGASSAIPVEHPMSVMPDSVAASPNAPWPADGPGGVFAQNGGDAVGGGGAGGTEVIDGVVYDSATGEPVMTEVPTSFSLGGVGANIASMPGYAQVGIPAAIATTSMLAGRDALDVLKGKGKSWGEATPQEKYGRLSLAIATGGLSEMARPFLGHESTAETEARRWGAVGPGWASAYAAAHPENDSGVWQSGKYAGEKWSFDKALDRARENPDEFRGVLGNAETFGNEWFNVSPEKQREVVNSLIENNLYDANKGDILIKDQAKAKDIYNSILNRPPAT